MLRAGVSVFTERAYRDRGYIWLIDWRGRNCEVWPAHYVAGSYLGRPPAQGVRSEHPWPHERPLESGGLDQPLDRLGTRPGRIGLPEQWMCGFERRREEYDAPGALRDPLQSGSNSIRWCTPHQDHRTTTTQAAPSRPARGKP